MNALIVIGVVMLLILGGIFLYYIIIRFKEEKEITDDIIFRNFMPQYTNGFSHGVILNIDRGDKRTGIEFMPKDINYADLFRGKEPPIEPQLIYVENGKLLSFPKGTFSSRRNEMWALPPNPENLPKEVRKTEWGKYLIEMIDKINEETVEIESIREGANRVRNIIKRQGGGEVSETELKRLEELQQDKLRMITKTEDKGTRPFQPVTKYPPTV